MEMKKEYHQMISRNDSKIREMFVIPGVCGQDQENPDVMPKYGSFQDFLVDMNKASEQNIATIDQL